MIEKKIKEVDEKIYECFKRIPFISYLTPINLDSEKNDFLLQKKINPEFTYKEPSKQILEAEKELKKIKIPKNFLKDLFEKRKKELLEQIKIIKNLNNENPKTKEISSRLYGWPNKKTIDYSKKLLNKPFTNSEVYEFSSEVLFEKIKKKIKKKSLCDWEVYYFNGKITQTTSSKKIFIPKNKIFSKLDIKRLPVHEVEIHATRYENSYKQPLKIFLYGFPGFLQTEEGLAVFIEEKTRNKNKASFRDYAGRVFAIQCLKKGDDFRNCFEKLKELSFSDEKAWDITFKIYRGEGFVKDHIYLQGYLSIKEFFKNKGELKKLFIGKIGINDLETIKKLEEKNLINKKLIYPSFLERIIKTNNN